MSKAARRLTILRMRDADFIYAVQHRAMLEAKEFTMTRIVTLDQIAKEACWSTSVTVPADWREISAEAARRIFRSDVEREYGYERSWPKKFVGRDWDFDRENGTRTHGFYTGWAGSAIAYQRISQGDFLVEVCHNYCGNSFDSDEPRYFLAPEVHVDEEEES